MDKNQILEKLKNIFRDFFDKEDMQIEMNTTAEDIEDWDSVAHIQLIFDLETEFGIQFEAEKIAEMNSIEKMIDEIQALV